jgi:hypothetical protein
VPFLASTLFNICIPYHLLREIISVYPDCYMKSILLNVKAGDSPKPAKVLFSITGERGYSKNSQHNFFYVHESVHRNINLIERTNKMRPCSGIYYCNVSLTARHVSGDKPPIIRSSKTVIAASGFTYVFGCRPLRWLSHHSGRQQ